MQAMTTTADLYAHYYHAESPTSFGMPEDNLIVEDELLPEKSGNEKEIDRREHYFSFADKAKSKLEAHNLWDSGAGGGKGAAKPDAGERLKKDFSKVLTAFVNLGNSDKSEKPVDRLPGIAFASQLGFVPITAGIFIFNTIVSQLKIAFPSHRSYFDQAGKLAYFLVSAVHSGVSAALSVVSAMRSASPDPISYIVLVSVEILLGFFATVTATETSLAGQCKKREHLTDLINAKAEAASFFEKARAGLQASAQEALAYVNFMTAVGKLDRLSADSKFGSQVAATVATKEWLWFGGAVVGNETGYRNLDSTQIAVSGAELLSTTLSEMAMSLVANIADLVQGVVVAGRCEQRVNNLAGLEKQLRELSRNATAPVMDPLIKGLARIIGEKKEEEKFEQGFSGFRMFKALAFISIGIVSIVAAAFSIVLAAPWIMGLTAGTILAGFFIFLIVRSIRSTDRARNEKKEEQEFKEKHVKSKNELLDSLIAIEESTRNKFFLFNTLAVALVDKPELWEKGEVLDTLFTALNFHEIEIAVLKTLANTCKAQAEDDTDYEESAVKRKKNSELLASELARIIESKLAGA